MRCIAAILLAGCGALRDTAHQADATTTVVGVASGAAVGGNPLISNWQTGALLIAIDPVAIAYRRATAWARTSPSFTCMLQMLGKTDAQADAFFISASQIKL